MQTVRKIGTATKCHKPMRSYLGLSIGNDCGYARIDTSNAGWSYMTGQWSFGVRNQVERYSQFRSALYEQFNLGVDKVYYEIVQRHVRYEASQVYGAFLATLAMECEANGVEIEGIDSSEITTFATGWSKATSVKKACNAWGFNPETKTEANAITILKCGYEFH